MRIATLTAEGHEFAATLRLGERQQAALDRLRGSPDGVPLPDLAAQGITPTRNHSRVLFVSSSECVTRSLLAARSVQTTTGAERSGP
jgi:hypothetical protein